jgi:negative regulator of sigma E activity
MTTDRDGELSALLDGALSPREEAALREEIARSPQLAARFEQLAQVDAALRALPSRPVPSDLRARLQAKLDAEAHAVSARAPRSAARAAAPARPSRRRAWMAGFGAAAAAATAALVVVVSEPATDGRPSEAVDLALNPPGAVTPDAAGQSLTPGIAAGSLEGRPVGGSERVAAVEAPSEAESAPSELDAQASESEPAANEFAEPAVVDPSRVAAVVEPPPGESALQGEQVLSVPATGAPIDPSASRLALGSPPLYVEVTDEEADALGELEPHDAMIVGVLDLLGELDELDAEASG